MNKTEFAEIMQDLSNAYRGKFALKPDDTLEVKKDILETWYRFFGEFNNDAFKQVTNNWIKRELKPPTISDLYKDVKEASDRMVKDISRNTKLPSRWDYEQDSLSKTMSYPAWIKKFFGVDVDEQGNEI